MKKNKLQNQFLDELAKVPIIQVASEKSGLSRQSIYRWKREDQNFAKKMEEAMEAGIAFVNDMSESQLLQMIKEKNWSAISFWLKHRHDKYKTKVHVEGSLKTIDILSPEQEKTVKEALKLAGLIHEDGQGSV
jgi:hypothetical protein